MVPCRATRAPSRPSCDPAYAAGTPREARTVLARMVARRKGEVREVPGSSATCAMGADYLRRLFFLPAGCVRAKVDGLHPSYDLLTPSERMAADYAAIGLDPGDVAIEAMRLARAGWRLRFEWALA